MAWTVAWHWWWWLPVTGHMQRHRKARKNWKQPHVESWELNSITARRVSCLSVEGFGEISTWVTFSPSRWTTLRSCYLRKNMPYSDGNILHQALLPSTPRVLSPSSSQSLPPPGPFPGCPMSTGSFALTEGCCFFFLLHPAPLTLALPYNPVLRPCSLLSPPIHLHTKAYSAARVIS